MLKSLAFVVIMCLMSVMELHAQSKVSTYFSYQGYSSVKYKGYQVSSQYVSMPDRIDIAVDVLKPVDGPPLAQAPVVCMITPYNRSLFAPKMNPLSKLLSKVLGLGWGPVYDIPQFYRGANLLLEHGYILVIADMRGTGASFGTQMPLMPQLGYDGKFLIDWIEAQPWCDGHVGMMGPSYLGWIQFMTAAQKPNALKCIMPEVMGFNAVEGGDRPGGILAKRWVDGFSKVLQGYNLNLFEWRKGILPAVPVIDEDEDGRIIDEWHGLTRSEFLKPELEPSQINDGYAVGGEYWQATKQHTGNRLMAELADTALIYMDSYLPPPYDHIQLKQTNPGFYAHKLAESEIPIYLVGGWFDGFLKGTTVFYSTLAESNPVKLMIAPRHHVTLTKAYRSFFDYQGDYWDELATEQLRFFDRYLKHIPNGIEEEPPVYIYVMHRDWRAATSWPLNNETSQTLYLGKKTPFDELART